MKIHQLPMHARFEYEGKEYVKTGPLLATGPGGQRLIPKYAVLKVIGAEIAVTAKKSTALSRDAVRAAFDLFYVHCEALVPADRQADLQVARAAFLRELE
jgi:hypothetical protein